MIEFSPKNFVEILRESILERIHLLKSGIIHQQPGETGLQSTLTVYKCHSAMAYKTLSLEALASLFKGLVTWG